MIVRIVDTNDGTNTLDDRAVYLAFLLTFLNKKTRN